MTIFSFLFPPLLKKKRSVSKYQLIIVKARSVVRECDWTMFSLLPAYRLHIRPDGALINKDQEREETSDGPTLSYSDAHARRPVFRSITRARYRWTDRSSTRKAVL